MALLNDQAVSQENRLRLILIYLITNGGLKPEDRAKLVSIAGLTATEAACADSLWRLGVKVLKRPEDKRPTFPPFSDDFLYPASRYELTLSKTLTSLCNNTLSSTAFPAVKEASLGPAGMDRAKGTVPVQNMTSLRAGKPLWQTQREEQQGIAKVTGERLILFFLGGISWSELRAVYEAARKYKRDILIGTTQMLTPADYLRELQAM